jgi:hypothetical protein
MNNQRPSHINPAEPDPFERRLARIPLRAAPPELRERVLGLAATEPRSAPVFTRTPSPKPTDHTPRPMVSERAAIQAWWARLPLATASVASVWIIAALCTVADSWLNTTPADATAPVSTAQIVQARRQRADLWRMAGLGEESQAASERVPETPSTDALRRPRSDRRRLEPFGSCRLASPQSMA